MFGFGPMMGGFGGWGYGNGIGGWGMGLIGMLVPLVIFLAIVFFLYHFFNRNLRHGNYDAASHFRAQEILAERFARGEISEDEYKRLKNTL